jgi:6-phosphogluconate dehydrogenase
MIHTQPPQRYEIGMVGLGVMGRNLVRNIGDYGCAVADYDEEQPKLEAKIEYYKLLSVRPVR